MTKKIHFILRPHPLASALEAPIKLNVNGNKFEVPFDTKTNLPAGVQRHGGTNDGAGFVMVAEDGTGAVVAFVAGVLGRVYSIGDMLSAQDGFLLGRKDASPRALLALFREYIAWASANPKVYEIGASWSDAISGSDNFEAVYLAEGFVPCAQTFRRPNCTSNTNGAEDV